MFMQTEQPATHSSSIHAQNQFFILEEFQCKSCSGNGVKCSISGSRLSQVFVYMCYEKLPPIIQRKSSAAHSSHLLFYFTPAAATENHPHPAHPVLDFCASVVHHLEGECGMYYKTSRHVVYVAVSGTGADVSNLQQNTTALHQTNLWLLQPGDPL